MAKSVEASAVIKYWRAIELFSPQGIPDVAPEERTFPVFSVTAENPVPPWNSAHPLRRRRLSGDYVWKHRLYVGAYSIDTVRQVLEAAFGKDPEAVDERQDGETAMFSVCVADDGRPLFDTLVLSTCVWGVGQTLKADTKVEPGWLDGFKRFHSEFEAKARTELGILPDDPLKPFFAQAEQDVGRPVNTADVVALAEWLKGKLSVDTVIGDIEIRVTSYQVSRKNMHEPEEADFLNSFFVDDLESISEAVAKGDSGAALREYMSSDGDCSRMRRVDTREELDRVFETLAPQRFPAGKWPGQGHHPLVYSQQFAINSIWRSLASKGGLFGVNGPPGTGKTTMLRDLVAAVVVERAKRLAELAAPADGFSGRSGWKTGKWNRSVTSPVGAITGFEIVAASSNNGAVENITVEIPGKDAIDAEWRDFAQYFVRFGEQVIQRPAWGLLAAKLGNKTNREEFVSDFWFGKDLPPGFVQEDFDVAKTGFESWLKGAANKAVDWTAAVREFSTTLKTETDERAALTRTYERVRALHSKQREVTVLQQEILDLVEALPSFSERIKSAKRELEPAALLHHAYAASQSRHRGERPGFMMILRTFGTAYRDWHRADQAMTKACGIAEEQLRNAQRNVAVATAEHVEARNALRSMESQKKQTEAEIEKLQATIAGDKAALGNSFPDIEQWRQSEDARELSSPWATKSWGASRSKVFLAALKLHKAFITANADTVRKNLAALSDILKGAAPRSIPRDAALGAWQTLFLVVPVVSSTFASFSRLFSHLGKEDIGWLLIDEAGQAVPQAAVGAIWRSRRVVVVGDPLQLEPVVSIPFTAQHALLRHFGLSETWLPGKSSTQRLADRATAYGTRVAQNEESLWVGSPLRVHRRCDREMFDISNKIAYGGLMVFGTLQRESSALPPTAWHDVLGIEAEKHWIQDEGERVRELVHDIRSSGYVEDIFLISPFRTVVDGLRRLQRTHSLERIKVGTIHTVQGKECDVVILVLGGNPRRPGARAWAAEKPNLLNVAATRAKRRLYVVGNQQEWSKLAYFDYCALRLSETTVARSR